MICPIAKNWTKRALLDGSPDRRKLLTIYWQYNRLISVYDLVVVGAGPAGSNAARTAAGMGMKVLVLEKKVFPRYKACGGALTERAASCLGLRLPESICERTITGARIHFRDLVQDKSKGYRLTTLVTRSAFDQFLLRKAEEAGAGISFSRALSYSEREDHVSVRTRDQIYRSRFLVIASGCQDALKEGISGKVSRDDIGICLVTEIEADDREIESRLGSLLDIHFGIASGGYGWIFPHRGYYSVGIGGLASQLRHPRQIMRRFLLENGFEPDQLLHGHTIPMGGRKRRIAQGRVLLTGDAASLVDAFTGEGIYYALRSGRMAAEAIGEKEERDVARFYEMRCNRELGEELRYALLISRAMHSHPKAFSWVLERHNEALDRYIEIPAARRSYKEFVRWLAPRLPLGLSMH